MSRICLPPVAKFQPVKVDLTTLMFGYLALACMKPLCRSVSAWTPAMPRISTTLPLPPSCLNSHCAPSRPLATWSFVTLIACGAVTVESTEMIFTPRAAAWAMAAFSAVGLDGLTMIAFAPAEIRLRMSAFCSAGPPLRFATTTLLILPLAFACAFTAQIISSRQPLPTSVLETPSTHFFVAAGFASARPTPIAATAATASPTQAASTAARRPVTCLMPSSLCLRPSWSKRFYRVPHRKGSARMCSFPSLVDAQHLGEPTRVLAVRRVEQTPRLPLAHDRRARQHRRQGAARGQELRCADLHRVGERDRRHGRTRPDRRRDAVEPDERVAWRRAQVEHDVGVVEEPRAGRVLRRRRERMGDGGDGDHRQPRLAGPARHLDRHGGEAAVAEDDHRVGRAQREVGQDLGGEPLGALDEHRLPLAVRADDLRMEGHRELDDRVEPRIRAVAREHLLDRDPRMAGAEHVHESAAADRVRADPARALHRLALGLEPLEQRLRGLE